MASYRQWVVDIWDTFRLNNGVSKIVMKPKFANGHTFTFNETDLTDYYYKTIVKYGKVTARPINGYPNGKVLQFTSGNVFSYFDLLAMPAAGQEWTVNEMLSAKASFCYDATTLTYLHVNFDLKQTSGGDLYSSYLGAGDYSSASVMRILVNGQHANNQTFKPTTTSVDPYTNKTASLNNYVGNILEVTFETRNIAADTMGFTLDNAYIDNLNFIENSGDKIDETNLGVEVQLYPNPASNHTNLYINSSEIIVGNLQLVDFLGKTLVSKPVLINSGENLINIDFNGFANGMYVIKIQTPKGEINRKVLISK
jgi:hypothetical protein